MALFTSILWRLVGTCEWQVAGKEARHSNFHDHDHHLLLCMTTTTTSFNGASSTAFDGGCQSTHLHSGSPDQTNWQATGHWWDGDTGSWSTGHLMVALIQFAAIFGHGSHQITPHDTIVSASLRYNIDLASFSGSRGDSAQLHEIIVPWNATTTTWRSFTGNNGLGYSEYGRAAVATVVAQNAGWHELDVTSSLLRWQADPVHLNHGWIILPQGPHSGPDGGIFMGCRAAPDLRLNLRVTYAQTPPMPPTPPLSPPPPPLSSSPPSPPPSAPSVVHTLAGPSVSQSNWIRSTYPNTVIPDNAERVLWFDGNSHDENNRDYSLIRWDLTNVSFSSLESAYMRYYVGGHAGSSGHMGEVHELMVDWSESTVTYNNLPYVPSIWGRGGNSTTYSDSINDAPCSLGWQNIDVSESVRAWLSGLRPNYGFIFVPSFNNGCAGVEFEQ